MFGFLGALIGLLQAPIVLLVSDTIGGSSGYVTVVSQLFYNKSLQRMFPYLASRRSGVGNWWQVCTGVISPAIKTIYNPINCTISVDSIGCTGKWKEKRIQSPFTTSKE